MKSAAILIAAALCAAPAFAQDSLYPQTSPEEGLRDNLTRSYAMAGQALQIGDYKTARRYAVLVTRGDPTSVPAWLMLGAAQSGLQDWKAARQTYATLVRLEPSNARAHAGLGVALAKVGDAKAADQLAWLTAQAQACRANCGPLLQGKAEVAAALAGRDS